MLVDIIFNETIGLAIPKPYKRIRPKASGRRRDLCAVPKPQYGRIIALGGGEADRQVNYRAGRSGDRAFYKTIRFLRKQSDRTGSVVKSTCAKSVMAVAVLRSNCRRRKHLILLSNRFELLNPMQFLESRGLFWLDGF